jgi:hypothetical protein
MYIAILDVYTFKCWNKSSPTLTLDMNSVLIGLGI